MCTSLNHVTQAIQEKVCLNLVIASTLKSHRDAIHRYWYFVDTFSALRHLWVTSVWERRDTLFPQASDYDHHKNRTLDHPQSMPRKFCLFDIFAILFHSVQSQHAFYHWRELPQVWFFATSMIFVATTVLLWETRVCRHKTRLLSRQKYARRDKTFCRGKHVFAATKDVFCRNKGMLAATDTCLSRQIFVGQKPLSRQKWYLCPLPPMITSSFSTAQ